MRGQRRGTGGETRGARPVRDDHVVVAEDVEDRERRPARERVAGVAVGVQEAAGDVVVVERGVHVVGGQHAGEGKVAAGDALRQQQEVGRDPGLLAGEERAGATEAGHDLVGDQVHAVARAQFAGANEVVRVVHRHAGRALHQRLDDQRGRRRVVPGEVRLERARRPLGDVARRLTVAGEPRIGRGHGRVACKERLVGRAEQRHVGDGERAQRLAVVAAGDAHEAALLRLAAVRPGVEAHLERDLRRRGAVGAVARVTESRRRQCREPFRELDHGTVGEAREQHVLERRELVDDRGVDARVRVAEQVDPPRRDGVEVAAPLEVEQPRALAARDRHDRQRLVHLHLRARVEHRRAASREPGGVPARCRLTAHRSRRSFMRSTAATSSRAIPGSRTEWPASGTTTYSASGHACASS